MITEPIVEPIAKSPANVPFHTMLPKTEPSCYGKVISDPWWQAAMCLEFEALISNKTWTLCPRPSHQHVIHNKWVYKIKRKSDGAVDRLKARLVVKGFEQTSGVEYTDTFSPIIKPPTICRDLSVAWFSLDDKAVRHF